MPIKNNRWEAQDDELAVIFPASRLAGLFAKNIHVPAGARAYVVGEGEDGEVKVLMPGEHSIQDFIGRVNAVFRSKPVDIMIARDGISITVPFSAFGLMSRDAVEMDLQLSLVLRIAYAQQFCKAFMPAGERSITTRTLQSCLKDPVCQILTEKLIEEDFANLRPDALRGILVDALRSAPCLTGLGLDLVEVSALRLDRHQAQAQVADIAEQIYLDKIEQHHEDTARQIRALEENMHQILQNQTDAAREAGLQQLQASSQQIDAESARKDARLKAEHERELELIRAWDGVSVEVLLTKEGLSNEAIKAISKQAGLKRLGEYPQITPEHLQAMQGLFG